MNRYTVPVEGCLAGVAQRSGTRKAVVTLLVAVLPAAVLLAGWHAAGDALGGEPRTDTQPDRVAVHRAIVYLSAEVTSWNKGHACYSCHNSGDAIRALLVARQQGDTVESEGLQTTIDWLRRPGEWSRNGPEGEFNDRRLAQLQFSSALAAAEAGQESAQRPLQVAAGTLARHLQPDGSWPSNQIGTIGSPITYGPFLATVQARSVLQQADARRFSNELDRTDRWLRASQPKSVLNAAAVLWAIARDSHPDAVAARERCLDLIRRGQSDDGGWGAYVASATEPFDTAVVVLALQAVGDKQHAAMINDGRDFLVTTQLTSGCWPETTRPADRDSYAHRVSTTAWCLQALVTAAPD